MVGMRGSYERGVKSHSKDTSVVKTTVFQPLGQWSSVVSGRIEQNKDCEDMFFCGILHYSQQRVKVVQ